VSLQWRPHFNTAPLRTQIRILTLRVHSIGNVPPSPHQIECQLKVLSMISSSNLAKVSRIHFRYWWPQKNPRTVIFNPKNRMAAMGKKIGILWHSQWFCMHDRVSEVTQVTPTYSTSHVFVSQRLYDFPLSPSTIPQFVCRSWDTLLPRRLQFGTSVIHTCC